MIGSIIEKCWEIGKNAFGWLCQELHNDMHRLSCEIRALKMLVAQNSPHQVINPECGPRLSELRERFDLRARLAGMCPEEAARLYDI